MEIQQLINCDPRSALAGAEVEKWNGVPVLHPYKLNIPDVMCISMAPF